MVAEELKTLGASKIQLLKRAVSCEGDKKLIYKANLHLRTGLRVLLPLETFRARTPNTLYRKVKEIDWSRYMTVYQSLAIDSVVSSPYFKHSKFTALKVKDAIVDQFREKTDKRPNINTVAPDLRLNLHIDKDQCTLSLDSSGDSLNRRGYRKEGYLAPLNEVLAAGMILMTGYDGSQPFIDPMCGSGTLLNEAAMIATRTPPQINRTYFCFQRWSNFDKDLWATILTEAREAIRLNPQPILGFDKAFQAVRIAQRNLERAGFQNHVKVARAKFEKNIPTAQGAIVVINPPYGERLATNSKIEVLYQQIGDQLKQHYTGHTVWLMSANRDAIKKIGLRASEKIMLYNGKLECRYMKFEMYEGSKAVEN